jgi:hypothetical protein
MSDISHVIQLAIAPVFLLTAVAGLLNVLVSRLGRAVDRRRVLAARLPGLEPAVAAEATGELGYLERRERLIYSAIALAVSCALLICVSISLAFVDAFVRYELAKAVAALFMVAMLALVCSLAYFLREIFLAVYTVRCPIV